MANSKNKGNSFERLICKKLSLFLTDNQDERICWRTSSSGGTSTNLKKKNNKSSFVEKNEGDIAQTVDKGVYPNVDLFFEDFIVECKAYKTIDFYPPLKGNLKEFIDQCKRQIAGTKKHFFLIAKANNRKIMCISNDDLFWYATLFKNPIQHIVIIDGENKYYVHLFDELIK